MTSSSAGQRGVVPAAKKIFCRIYVRVSSGEQADTGNSIENQKAECRKYAVMKGFTVVKTYEDRGVSGKKLNRPEFVKLREDIKEGEHLIAFSVSRLSRSIRDFIEILEWAEDKVVTIHTLKENIDTKSAYGSFVTMLFANLSQLESNLTQERMQEINNRKIKRGETTRSPPYGYRSVKYAEGQPARLIPDLCEQVAINRMIELRQENVLKNLPLRQLANMLSDEGYKPRRSGRFKAETIRLIISREIPFRMKVHGMSVIPKEIIERYIDLRMPFIVPISRMHDFIIVQEGRETYNGLYEDSSLSIEKPKFFGRGSRIRKYKSQALTPLDIHLLTYDKDTEWRQKVALIEDGEIFRRRILIEEESQAFRKILEKLLISQARIDSLYAEIKMQVKEQFELAEMNYKIYVTEKKNDIPGYDETTDVEALKRKLEMITLAKKI